MSIQECIPVGCVPSAGGSASVHAGIHTLGPGPGDPPGQTPNLPPGYGPGDPPSQTPQPPPCLRAKTSPPLWTE